MEPIAITGIGCRLPGDMDSPEALWRSLLEGRDLITETPADHWSLDAYFSPSPSVPGRTYTRWGGYLSRVDQFDAGFFGISPREALRIDPQQRWLLETAWEALEDAGLAHHKLAGADVAVYVGLSSADYGDIQKRGRYEVDAYTNSGNALSIAANRISYLLDFRGPSLVVDTACSSSLVALDLACRTIWRGEAPLALVAGANSLLTPDLTIGFAKASMLSPEGRCKSFDAAANGYVRSEGAVCVVLKPLSAALRDGDRVYASIRSTHVNQDGRSGSMTVPNVDQQVRLLVSAYQLAGVRPEQVGFVEAHGTGTPVGDPIEAIALGRVLGQGRSADQPLWIGSIKSNLGHVEPASGVAGLIKLALALYHRTIPPNLHFHAPSPHIPFDEYHLRVPTVAIPWPALPGEELLYGGVNSFGFGGTNAHAVLSSAPRQAPAAAPGGPTALPPCYLWTVSAPSKEALRQAARQDAVFLQQATGSFANLTSTVQRRRSQHAYRLAVVADDASTAAQCLQSWAEDSRTEPHTVVGQAGGLPADVVFVFSGQGSQWPAMARELFESEPLFRDTIEQFDALMRPLWGHSLTEVVQRDDDSVFQTGIGQPLFFALQVGVARLLMHWGIRPARVLGHSAGAMAAAHVAGALSPADAARLVIERSCAQEKTRGSGTMAAVGVSLEEMRSLLACHDGRVHVAAVNCFNQLTLAGEDTALQAVVQELSTRGKFARVLPIPYAYHTRAMDPVRDGFCRSVAGLQPRASEVPYTSTVTATELPGEALGVDYWWSNLREPVQFVDAMRQVLGCGHRVFLEIGPHPSLVRYIQELLAAEGVKGLAVGTLRRQAPGSHCLRETVAALHVRGLPVDWERLTPGDGRHRPFPRYPWQRQSFWAEAEDARALRLGQPIHPLLGMRQGGPALVWQADLGTDSHPFLADHGLEGKAVFPGAGYLEIMLAGAAEGRFETPVEIVDVHVERILWLDQAVLMQTVREQRSRQVAVFGKPAGGKAWQRHARALGRVVERPVALPRLGRPPDDLREIDVSALYLRFQRSGHCYGPAFRTIRSCGVKDGEYWGRIALDPALVPEAARYFIHPTLLDGAFQMTLCTVPLNEEREALFLPVHIDSLHWERPAGAEIICRVFNAVHQDARSYADIELYAPDGQLVASLTRCCCLKREQDLHLAKGPAALYRETWLELPLELEAGGNGHQRKWALCSWAVDPEAPSAALAREGVSVQPCGEAPRAGASAVIVWCAGAADRSDPSPAAACAGAWRLARLVQSLSAEPREDLELVLVTAGAVGGLADGEPPDLVQAPLAGLFRTITTELQHARCRLIDLGPAEPQLHAAQVARELHAAAEEEEVAYRGGQRFVRRLGMQALKELRRRPLLSSRRACSYALESLAPGSLDHLAWAEQETLPPAQGEIEIAVRAAGLNFRDVLKALDLYPLQPNEPRWFGDECAGVVRRVGPGVTEFQEGDEVVAVAPGCFGRHVRVPACLVARKPTRLSFLDAAAAPIAFLTADYSLTNVARIEPGETVLIHAAAGGVGLAAVQIALAHHARVLGTASPEKHAWLRSQGVEHVFHSRNLSFVDGVRSATGGAGVDVVLNSLAGDLLVESLGLLKPLGRFVEIGKRDIFQNEALDLHAFRTAISFHAVDLARVILERPEWIGRRLRDLLLRLEQGALRPLPVVAYAADQVGDAFRLMAQGKHRGKVVLTFNEAEPPADLRTADVPPIRAGATYLITGGLSGLGWATAEWLVDQGADSLVLVSRSGAGAAEVQTRIEAWRGRGVGVRVDRCDMTSQEAVEALLHDVRLSLPPLAGVFHSAMVLRDEPLARATAEAFEEVLGPKVQGAWNLHCACTGLSLDFFVLYSSCATLFGSAGQAAYVAANSFLNALAEFRRACGLPAQAIGWGPLADFGVVARSSGLARYLENAGFTPLHKDELFRWLKFLLRRDLTVAPVLQIDWAKYGAANPKAGACSRFREVLAGRAATEAGDAVLARLAAADAAGRRLLLLGHLRRLLAGVLSADEATLDEEAPLTGLGLDSLMAFELKMKLDRDLQISFPVEQLVSDVRLATLVEVLLAQLDKGNGAAADTPARPPAETAPGRERGEEQRFFHILSQAAAEQAPLRFDAAALAYLPDKLHTLGGLSDAQMKSIFGVAPFVSNTFDTPLGRIGVITLPVRSSGLFHHAEVCPLLLQALELAGARGAACLSLTGLIPSAMEYGLAIESWRAGVSGGPVLTTGHATTTAAVVLNLDNMLRLAGRAPDQERLAVLGLGSIGQSCLRLMLEVLPHPRELILCDLFTKADVLQDFTRVIREEHGYRGPLRILRSHTGVPDELYMATTLLAAVSVPDVLDVARLRPGTVVVDDSYPPALSVSAAARRIEASADILFSNAGMLRLSAPITETMILPAGAEPVLERFGREAFHEEVARDPHELTACVLSSVLTGRFPGFGATLGLARALDLVSHYRGLEEQGLSAARLQGENYFVPEEVVRRFSRRQEAPTR